MRLKSLSRILICWAIQPQVTLLSWLTYFARGSSAPGDLILLISAFQHSWSNLHRIVICIIALGFDYENCRKEKWLWTCHRGIMMTQSGRGMYTGMALEDECNHRDHDAAVQLGTQEQINPEWTFGGRMYQQLNMSIINLNYKSYFCVYDISV